MAPAMFAKHSLAAGLFASALPASCASVQKAAQKPSVKLNRSPQPALVRMAGEPAPPAHIYGNVIWSARGIVSLLITTPKGHFLIDGAIPEAGPEIAQNIIGDLGFNPKNVRYLLNTHEHFDHSGGLCGAKAADGCTHGCTCGSQGCAGERHRTSVRSAKRAEQYVTERSRPVGSAMAKR